MAPHIQLFVRDDSQSDSSNSLNPTIIVGIVVVGLIAVGAAIWLGIHYYRKKATAKREDSLGASFLSVRGIVKDNEEKGYLPDAREIRPNPTGMFSREQVTNVVMPAKAVLRPDASKEEIIEHFAAEGTLPRPFAPFAMSIPRLVVWSEELKPPRPMSGASFLSALSGGSLRSSVISSRRMSTASTASSVLDSSHKRKVRQLFNPALPDELVLSLGERVTVVQSYDDGWCIVGRDSFMNPGDAELGAVPAWCFVKPTKGLKAERPIRTSSLGVTVILDGPGVPRQDVISWSNFS
ncbi:hypothetical protein B0H21DRAFT_46296 [Amylocystis lapponica]|nr:hypothetical protein B0H21DRAFT_46296 [Amylocystis lapponica]